MNVHKKALSLVLTFSLLVGVIQRYSSVCDRYCRRITGTAGSYVSTFITTLFSTFSIVVKTPDEGDSGDGDGGGESSSNHAISTTPTTSTFVNDTTADLSVNGAYQFKIAGTNGAVPSFVVGMAGVFDTQLVSVSGNIYYFKLTAVGKPGDKAGIYVNGVRLLVATVKATASLVRSDTTAPFKVAKGKTVETR